jgi:hypothetical protein
LLSVEAAQRTAIEVVVLVPHAMPFGTEGACVSDTGHAVVLVVPAASARLDTLPAAS